MMTCKMHPKTTIGPTCNQVQYRRRSRDDLKVIPYNADLTRKCRGHFNLELTQGAGAIAYIMKYAFKTPNPTDVQMDTTEETGSSSSKLARENIRNGIRLYMRAEVLRSVEVAWQILEFINVRIYPSVTCFTPYIEGINGILRCGMKTAALFHVITNYETLHAPIQMQKIHIDDYMEKGNISKTLPASNQINTYQIPPRGIGGQETTSYIGNKVKTRWKVYVPSHRGTSSCSISGSCFKGQ